MNERIPDGRDRKVLRAAALEMHALATRMKHRHGRPMPPDDPVGYVAAFAAELRAMARLLEGASRGATVAEAKRLARDLPNPPAIAKARINAVNALMNTVNRLAIPAGVDPFSGMKGEDVKCR